MSKDRRKLLHIHSSVNDKQPTPNSIELGELAVNNASGNAFISTKNTENKVVRFSEDDTIVDWIDGKEVFPNSGDVKTNADGTSSIDIHLNQKPSSKSPGSSGITDSSFSINTSTFALKSEVNGVLANSKVTTTTATTADNAYSSVTFTQSGETIGRVDIPSLVPVYDTITNNELVTSSALNDLNAKKLDASAYTQAISSLISTAEYNSTNKKIVFKNKNGVTQSEIDATSFIKDGMVENVAITNSNLVITFNTDSGKQPISIALADIFNPNNYYTKNEVDSELSNKQDVLISGTSIKTINNQSLLGSGNIDIQGGGGGEMNVQSDWNQTNTNADDYIKNKPTIPTVPTNVSSFANDAGYLTAHQDITGKADVTALTAVNNALTEHTSNTTVHITAAERTAWNNKSNFSGSYNDLTNKPTIPAAQVNSDWNATSGVAQILNKPTDLQLQANWTQTDTTKKDYIKNKPYFSGYYIANNTNVSSRQFVGVQKPDGYPNESMQYLYYYTGSSWRLVDRYVSPSATKYYIASTDIGTYTIGANTYRYPEGYVAYVNSSNVTTHIPYSSANYIAHSDSDKDPVSASTNYTTAMQYIQSNASIGKIPTLEGYSYVFSFDSTNKSIIDSNSTKFSLDKNLQNITEFIGEVNNQLISNSTKTNTGFFVYKKNGNNWTLIETNTTGQKNRSTDNTYPIDHYGNKENWDSAIWVQRFLGAQLNPLIKANEGHNFDYGWSDFPYSGFHIIGSGGWISGYVAPPKAPESGSSTAKLRILGLTGELSSCRFKIKDIVRFNFTEVLIGQKNDYAEMNSNASTPSTTAINGRNDMYDVTYSDYSYTIETLNNDTLSVVKLTQAQYDALLNKDNNTLYVIVN